MGRKKIQLQEADYNKISRLAGRGVSELDICKGLGISFPTWRRLKEEDQRAIDAFQEARKHEEEQLVGVLFEEAVNKRNTTAAMFLLKSRHGYVEGRENFNANQVNVKITLPGARSEDEYQKLVEVNNEQ